MTVSTETNSKAYEGTGANTALPTTFPFIDDTDLVVTQRVKTTGVETTLTLGTHYTVTGGSHEEGEVTPVDGATDFPSTVTWTITRDTPQTQLTNYVENDSFGAETHEAALDKVTYLAQDRQGEIDRSLKVAITDDIPAPLPTSTERAGGYLGFNGEGDPVALSAPVDTALVSTYMETLLDDADAAEARATIEAQEDVITDRGDLIQGFSDGSAVRFPKGSQGQVLAAGIVNARWSDFAPRGYLSGLTITRTSATEFNVGVGLCRGGSSSDQDKVSAKNTNAAFGKLFDSGSWDPGDGGGGVPSAAGFAAAVDTWHFFMLISEDENNYDFGWDTDIGAANLLADAAVITKLSASARYRKLHSFVSTATPDFADFEQIGDEIYLVAPVLDYDNVTADISAGITVVLASVPAGVRVKALIRISHQGAVQDPLQIRPSFETDQASTHTGAPLGAYINDALDDGGGDLGIWTNTSQQIFIRKADSTTTNYIVTRGWIDRRGRDD
jgi:hypothetical protein